MATLSDTDLRDIAGLNTDGISGFRAATKARGKPVTAPEHLAGPRVVHWQRGARLGSAVANMRKGAGNSRRAQRIAEAKESGGMMTILIDEAGHKAELLEFLREAMRFDPVVTSPSGNICCPGCNQPLVDFEFRRGDWHFACWERLHKNVEENYKAITGRALRKNTGKYSMLPRLLRGLASRGYTVAVGHPRLSRNHGQAMMNKAAGECAPTWEVRDATFENNAERLTMGRFPVTIGSFHPLAWVLTFKPEEWDIALSEDELCLLVTAPHNPPSWGLPASATSPVTPN